MRIIVFSEAVSLAHVVRSYVLYKKLSQTDAEVFFATDELECSLIDLPNERFIQLPCIGSKKFLSRIWKSDAPYRREDLEHYISCESCILEEFQPDFVIADCRPTLAIGCEQRNIRYGPLINAYWEGSQGLTKEIIPPFSKWNGFELPRINRINQKKTATASTYAVEVFNEIRESVGLSRRGDYFELMAKGDFRLFADPRRLFENKQSSDFFTGPLAWSFNQRSKKEREFAARTQNSSRPTAYLCLGSSGDPKILPTLLRELELLGFSTICSTAGSSVSELDFPHTLALPYCDGRSACQMADIVICNGGSPGFYQALEAGKPILGISSNFDQALNMANVRRHQLGVELPLRALNSRRFRVAIDETLGSHRKNASHFMNMKEHSIETLFAFLSHQTRTPPNAIREVAQGTKKLTY